MRHEGGAERAQLYDSRTARWVDPRTALWQELGFCASPEERTETLGESPDDARRNHARCQETVAGCARAPFEECARIVEKNFDGRLN